VVSYCFYIVLCIVSPFVPSLSYFCTILPTTATGWKPNCSTYHISYYLYISYHNASHHIKSHHMIYHIYIYQISYIIYYNASHIYHITTHHIIYIISQRITTYISYHNASQHTYHITTHHISSYIISFHIIYHIIISYRSLAGVHFFLPKCSHFVEFVIWMCVCVYIYIYIQGVPGGMCQT